MLTLDHRATRYGGVCWRTAARLTGHSGSPCAHPRDVVANGADVGVAPATKPAVCPSAESNVGQVVPVGEIVAALTAGPRPIRDLVVLKLGRAEPLDGKLKHVGGEVLVGWSHPPLLNPAEERCALLHDQRVKRQVVGTEGAGARERLGPHVYGLAGQRIDEV